MCTLLGNIIAISRPFGMSESILCTENCWKMSWVTVRFTIDFTLEI